MDNIKQFKDIIEFEESQDFSKSLIPMLEDDITKINNFKLLVYKAIVESENILKRCTYFRNIEKTLFISNDDIGGSLYIFNISYICKCLPGMRERERSALYNSLYMIIPKYQIIGYEQRNCFRFTHDKVLNEVRTIIKVPLCLDSIKMFKLLHNLELPKNKFKDMMQETSNENNYSY